MADEDVVFGLRYTGQGQVADLINDLAKVQRAATELAHVQPQNAGASVMEALGNTLRQQFSTLDAARARLAIENQKAADIADRIALTAQHGGPGVEAAKQGGYASQRAQDVAQLQSFASTQTAAKRLDAEYQKAAATVRQAAQAEQAIANVGKIVSRNLSEQATAGTTAARGTLDQAALQKRLAAATEARIKADQTAAKAAEEQAALTTHNQAVMAELAASRPQSYETPDVTSHLGVAQSRVNAAEINLELATRKLAEEENASSLSYERIRRAQQAQEAATQNLTRAQDNLALTQRRTQGTFAQQFQTGFKGTNQDRTYAEQIGQAFKFSVLYGTAYKVLFGITQTLQDALNEGIQFQQAMTELSIASGQSADQMESLRKNLGAAATEAGAAPSQGVLVGARSLGLFGATSGTGTSVAEQNRIAELSARVVSRASLGSGQMPEDIQRNLAAIAQAFQQGPEGQVRAYDLDAYLSRKFGVAAGGTYAPVSESATAGAAAGFSQEQITAIAALLQARTGQTGDAVAGYMAQIFSRSGEGALVGVEQKYGVDSTQNLANQIQALAQVYARTPEARDEISAAFGRGKVQNAAIALLQGFPAAQAAATQAQGGAALGAGDRAFNQRIDNVGGQLQILVGDLKAFESELGRSGVLAVVGGLVKTFDELLKGATAILQAWNQLPTVAKDVAFAIAALGLASRVAAGRISGAALLGGASQAEGAVGGAAGGASLASRAKTAGAIVGILAALDIIGRTIGSAKELDSTTSGVNAALSRGLGRNADPAALRSRAAELQLDADAADKAAHGFFAHVIDFGNKLTGDATAAQKATDAAQAAVKEANRLSNLAQYEQSHTQAPSQQLITDFSADALSTSLQSITDQGGNANDRLTALSDTLNQTAGAAARAQAGFDAFDFAGKNARGLTNALAGTGFVGQRELADQSRLGGFRALAGVALPGLAPGYKTTNALPDAIRSVLDPSQVQNRLRAALQGEGVTSLSDITPQVAQQLATSVVGDTPEDALKKLGITDPEQIQKLRDLQIEAVKKSLLRQARVVRDIISGKSVNLSPSDLTATVNQITSDTQEALGGLAQSDSGGRISAIRREIDLIKSAIATAPAGATSEVQDQLDSARRALAEAQIADLENLRKAAQQNADSKKEVAQIGHSFLVREIRAAVRGGDTDALVNIINIAGKGGEQIARTAIQQALTVARAALSMQAQIQQFAANEVAGIRGFIQSQGGNAADSAAQRRVDELQSMLASLGHAFHGNQDTNVFATGSDANLPGSLTKDAANQAAKDSGPTAAQIAAARQTALAAGSESQINQARAAMASARADMAAAKKGTVEYYNALGSYLQARNDLTDAVVAYNQNLYLLHHDSTDPIVQAQAAVRAAAAALRADAGKPADVRAADRVALQQAQTELESTRFQQRLDAAQTAEQLGQTSFRAYINYLDHEHDRLERIKHRSYQQQQELNQVDQLLQEASQSMQGIFNFGDINLPKPYQVQRYLDEHFRVGTDGAQGQPANRTENTFFINGADTAKVIKVIKDVLGNNTFAETTRPRKR